MYKVYIIYSESSGSYYVGHTEDVSSRLLRHNNSGNKSTKKSKDWKLMYTETFETRGEAMKRENAIKKKKSRKYIENLIRSTR